MGKVVLAKKMHKGTPIALINWEENTCTPYVVAWNCPFENMIDAYFGDDIIQYFDGSWGQGHYFCDEKSAVEFYIKNYAKNDVLAQAQWDYFNALVNEGETIYDALGYVELDF